MKFSTARALNQLCQLQLFDVIYCLSCIATGDILALEQEKSNSFDSPCSDDLTFYFQCKLQTSQSFMFYACMENSEGNVAFFFFMQQYSYLQGSCGGFGMFLFSCMPHSSLCWQFYSCPILFFSLLYANLFIMCVSLNGPIFFFSLLYFDQLSRTLGLLCLVLVTVPDTLI